MKKTIIFLGIILSIFFISCSLMAQDISEVKSEEYVGESVIVSGTVKNTIKIGDLSGYIIADDTDSIAVASNELPAEGDEITVSGTLRKNLVMYYIETD